MDRSILSRRRKTPKAGPLLALDAWIDSSIYEAGFAIREFWETLTIFFRRFRVYGWRRALVEAFSECLTLGAAGSVVLLALAMPAFQETAGDWLTQDDFAVTFIDRQGRELGQRGIMQRDSVPVEEMPDIVIRSVLATEDRRFFNHHGIDILGLFRAVSENLRANSVVQGGSSITQQLAKNLFLSNERTVERKVKEGFLAIWLEANLSKRQILQLYLDRVYMGGGTFGIAAAADFYFGKKVKDLDLAEAAMLAGLFKAPTRYAPHVNLAAARGRADVVLSNLVESGFMTEGQVRSARLHPADVVYRGETKSPDYFLDFAFEEAKTLGRKLGLRTMVARVTIDLDIQQAAEESLEFNLREHGGEYDVGEGAIVVLDNDGSVRAVVGGRDYGESQFNRATRALRQTGSSFKPYVYATAMEHGFRPGSVVSDGPINWGGWSPKNYGKGYAGKVTLATALIKSINTVPVRLAKDYLSLPPIQAMAEAMGVESALNGHKTMVLGTSGMTVMDQATGYNTFANGGYAGTRHAIDQLIVHGDDIVYQYGRNTVAPRRVLSQQALESMNSILVQIPEIGTAKRAALPGIRSAGKTGTTQSYRDAWYVGFTGNYTAAVWLGNDDFSPTRNMTGGSLPAMVWQRLMAAVHRNVELRPIPGIEHPLLDPQVVAKAIARGPVAPQRDEERRPVLSAETTRLLRALSSAFEETPLRPTIDKPETISAL